MAETPIDLDELHHLAQACDRMVPSWYDWQRLGEGPITDRDDIAFVTAVTPERVVAMIEELWRYRAAVAELPEQPVPARLGWRNPEDDPDVQLRLYAVDIDGNGRWTGKDGRRGKYGRTIEHALIEQGHTESGGTGERFAVVDLSLWYRIAEAARRQDGDL